MDGSKIRIMRSAGNGDDGASPRNKNSRGSAYNKQKTDPKARAAKNILGLHSDTIIQNQECDKWAKWYNNGEKRENPEFDIYGPYVRPEEKVRAKNSQDRELISTKLDALKDLQSSGKDIGGRSLRDNFEKQATDKGIASLLPPGLRTISDDQEQDIESGEWLTVSLAEASIRRLQVPGGKTGKDKDECLALVRTYASLQCDYDISGPSCMFGYRIRPFYKDYRHYSRHGFAGRGAKTSWARNPKLTSEDYDPSSALYTKPRDTLSSSAKHDEKYVHEAARCDVRPPLSDAQKKLLRNFPDHAIGKLPVEPTVKFNLTTSIGSHGSFTSQRLGRMHL